MVEAAAPEAAARATAVTWAAAEQEGSDQAKAETMGTAALAQVRVEPTASVMAVLVVNVAMVVGVGLAMVAEVMASVATLARVFRHQKQQR